MNLTTFITLQQCVLNAFGSHAKMRTTSTCRSIQPCVQNQKIDRWQVIFDAPIEKKDVEPWRARKCWQNLSFGDTSKKRLAEEIDSLTPNSKFKRTVEGLKSPSNRTDSQSSQ